MSKYKAKNFFESIKFAMSGLIIAAKSQRNFRIDLLIGTIVIILGVFFKFTMLEFVALLLVIGFVLLAELLNTIVEFIVDAYFKNTYSTLAKMSKDISAGMVLLAVILSIIAGALLFLPKFFSFLTAH